MTHPIFRRVRRDAGFTLAEIAVVLAIVAALAAAAFPSFVGAVHRGRRSEGTRALVQLQMAEERWRADHVGYSTDLGALGVAPATTSGYYTLSVSSAGTDTYVLTATAASSQAADSACALLQLSESPVGTAYGSTDASGQAPSVVPDPCWAR